MSDDLSFSTSDQDKQATDTIQNELTLQSILNATPANENASEPAASPAPAPENAAAPRPEGVVSAGTLSVPALNAPSAVPAPSAAPVPVPTSTPTSVPSILHFCKFQTMGAKLARITGIIK